jgi:hypothetical protein
MTIHRRLRVFAILSDGQGRLAAGRMEEVGSKVMDQGNATSNPASRPFRRGIMTAVCIVLLSCAVGVGGAWLASLRTPSTQPLSEDTNGGPNARNADATRDWIVAEVLRLDAISATGDMLRMQQEAKRAAKKLKTLEGQTVEWELTVDDFGGPNKTQDVRVGFDSDGSRIRLERGEKRWWRGCYALKIGSEITAEKAASLEEGDKITVRGKISTTSVSTEGKPTFRISFHTLAVE